ncbi:MAG: sigma-70 family RNA polymerase sigma factor [Paraclostridium sp.]
MKITEENFILKLKERDERALEYVIDNYGWIMKTIVKKSMYNLETYHEECINDVLLGIWNNIYSFDENKNTFKNWVAAITKYKTIDYQRKYLKNIDNQNIDDVDVKIEDNSHKEILENEISEEMQHMLSYLKERDRELFIKLYVDEQDIDSISEETGMHRDVIYNRVSRGKRKIKDMLKFGGR